MKNPLVTVFMATHNHAKYIKESLGSLIAQTIGPMYYEVIVINDGSTDETSRILEDYKDRINLIQRDRRGLVFSCNEGLSLAKGRYFTRLDSDDFVSSEWLQDLFEVLEHNPDACCSYPDRYEVGTNKIFYYRVSPENIYSLVACGTLFRTDIIRGIGGFRNFYWEEFDLYLRLRERGKFLHIPKPLYMYRKHNTNMTRNAAKRMEGWLELITEWGEQTLKSAGFSIDLEKACKSMNRGLNIDE